jgi:hypothetical protein
MNIYIHIHMHTYIHTFIHINIHTYTHIYTHTHTHDAATMLTGSSPWKTSGASRRSEWQHGV